MRGEHLKKFGQLCAANNAVRERAQAIGFHHLNEQIAFAQSLGLNFDLTDLNALAHEAGQIREELDDAQLAQLDGMSFAEYERPAERYTSYAQLLEAFSAAEMAQIVQLKRFFEWRHGDPDFAQSVAAGHFTPEQLARLQRIGVTFALNDIALIWQSPDAFAEIDAIVQWDCFESLPANLRAALQPYPLLAAWFRYVSVKARYFERYLHAVTHVSTHPLFDAWRERRIAAVKSELGYYRHLIKHRILSFELGDGCSVGCWFCGYAAPKLTKNFDYARQRDSVRQMIQTCIDLLGPAAARLGGGYFRTEPHDHPQYLDFVADYAALTGHTLFTSTAVATDASWIHTLSDYYRRQQEPWRISVLSSAALHHLHDRHTPDELRDADLLMQINAPGYAKIASGRILKERSGLRSRDGHEPNPIVPQGSIACISGFVMNLVQQTIELMSPCYASAQWQNGYRIMDAATYTDARDFRRVLETLIERNMPMLPVPERRARFRDDLRYRPTAEGFELISPNQIHHLTGQAVYEFLGRSIATGVNTYQALYAAIWEQAWNPMLGIAALKHWFDLGLLDEVHPDMASRRVPAETQTFQMYIRPNFTGSSKST